MPPKTFSPEMPERLTRRMAAKRTRKNSSKLFENIPKKRNLSKSGTVESAASCNTRALKLSQLFSRSINLLGVAIIYFCKIYKPQNYNFCFRL